MGQERQQFKNQLQILLQNTKIPQNTLKQELDMVVPEVKMLKK
jgi:hypothetical protein